MLLTKENLKQIEEYLYTRTVRDTELPLAESVNKTDLVPIVLKQKNKVLKFNDFIQGVINNTSDYIYNITAETGKPRLTLEQAISLVPENKKRLGLVITFRNENGNWMLYQFTGCSLSQWSSSNLWKSFIESALDELVFWPDEEDITSVLDGNRKVLKFKNRYYNPDEFIGKGMIILRRNPQGTEACAIDDEDHLINILTQDMISQPNTVYIVEYDFDLNGNIITVPENSVLWFQGGTINNGSIYLNGAAILGAFEFADTGNCNLYGPFNTGQIMTFSNNSYKKKEGGYFNSAKLDEKSGTYTPATVNDKAYTTVTRQELRWWSGEEWLLILDITDYNELKSIINDLINKHNQEIVQIFQYIKDSDDAILKKIESIQKAIDNLETTIVNQIKKYLQENIINENLTIKLGTKGEVTVYNGKEAKTVTITPEAIGAASRQPDGYELGEDIDFSGVMIAVYMEGKPSPDSPYEEWLDVGELTVPGNYRIQNCKGLPEDTYKTGKNPFGHTDYGQLLVLRGDKHSNTLAQIYVDWHENGGAYIRTGVSGGSGELIKDRPWIKLSTEKDFKNIFRGTSSQYVMGDGSLSDSLVADRVSKKLKFTGAQQAEYDGSSEVTINIPEGGSGGSIEPLTIKVGDGRTTAYPDYQQEVVYNGTQPSSISIPTTEVLGSLRYSHWGDLHTIYTVANSIKAVHNYPLIVFECTINRDEECKFGILDYSYIKEVLTEDLINQAEVVYSREDSTIYAYAEFYDVRSLRGTDKSSSNYLLPPYYYKVVPSSGFSKGEFLRIELADIEDKRVKSENSNPLDFRTKINANVQIKRSFMSEEGLIKDISTSIRTPLKFYIILYGTVLSTTNLLFDAHAPSEN